MTGVDYVVENHGSISLLRPLTGVCEDWIEDHVGYEQTWGNAIVVESRYLMPILIGLEAEGFVCA